MSDETFATTVKPVSWKKARIIWSAGGKVLPEKMSNQYKHYLTDLEHALANLNSARIVSNIDRERDWSFQEIAVQCRDISVHCRKLSEDLSKIDDIAFSRIAGASTVPFPQLLGQTIVHLDLLETALRNAQIPRIPHKKPQEHNYFLIIELADIYSRNLNRKATVTTNPTTDEREGQFVKFVMSFAQNLLPGATKKLNPRAILRAIKAQKDNPDPMMKP